VSALQPPPVTPGAFLCPRCGTPLRDEQAWCVECGLAARTRIHPPPGWRGPIALTLVLATLLAAGIAFALWTLLDTPQPAPVATTVTVPATTSAPPATTIAPTTTPTVPTTLPTTTPAPPGATVPPFTTPGSARVPTTTTPGTSGR
jgi:hypothetical protein